MDNSLNINDLLDIPGINFDESLLDAIEECTLDDIADFIFKPRRKDDLYRLTYKSIYAIIYIEMDSILDVLRDYFNSTDLNITYIDLVNYIDNNTYMQTELNSFIEENIDEYLSCFDPDTEPLPIGSADLVKNNDNVGDVEQISDIFTVDIGSRDYAFVYLFGKIMIGENDEIHSDIIKRYLNMQSDKKEYIRGDEAIQLTDDERIGFGHVSDNIAFIETCENVSSAEIKDALEKEYKFDKIYQLDTAQHEIVRLARRI